MRAGCTPARPFWLRQNTFIEPGQLGSKALPRLSGTAHRVHEDEMLRRFLFTESPQDTSTMKVFCLGQNGRAGVQPARIVHDQAKPLSRLSEEG